MIYIALRTFKYQNAAGEMVMAKPGDPIDNADSWPTGARMFLTNGYLRMPAEGELKKSRKSKKSKKAEEPKAEEVKTTEEPKAEEVKPAEIKEESSDKPSGKKKNKNRLKIEID